MYDFASNQLRSFAEYDDKLPFDLAWAPGGQAIYIVCLIRKQRTALQQQLARVSYPDAKFRSITNDTDTYHGVTISADGKTLATVQTRTANDIEILPGTGAGAGSILPGISSQEPIVELDWTADGQLLVSEDDKLLRTRPDGSNAATLLSDPGSYIKEMASCDAGKFIALTWAFHGEGIPFRIWRTNTDGSGQRVLTAVTGNGVVWTCSPDGNWVYYSDVSNWNGVLRLPAAGGKAEQILGSALPNASLSAAALSPDGKTLAVLAQQTLPDSKAYAMKIALVDLGADLKSPAHVLDVNSKLKIVIHQPGPPSNNGFHFTPDGKALAFVIQNQGVDNLWIQPLDGSPVRQITNFKSQEILDFRWSPDGKSLAVLRSDPMADAILLHDAEPAPQ